MKGLTIIYLGDGKGKTSAAVGLAVRAAGYGYKILFLQFIKGEWKSGETTILGNLPNIEVKIMGRGFVGIMGDKKELSEHIEAARKALAVASEALKSGNYFLVILDEAITAIETDLITPDDLLKLIEEKAEGVHLCLTGHKRIKKLIDAADLVTEMKKIKHPYYKGILAQRGIDY